MAARFAVLTNKDAAAGYVQALVTAGFEQIANRKQADFLLVDGEHAGGTRARIAEFLQTRPVFVYPHTPLAYFIWDEHYEPLPVQCNFVIGEAARRSMQLYGYPNRVEACGWNRCELKEFAPTTGRRLLFVPARTQGNGQYTNAAYEELTPKAFQWVVDHRQAFEHVTVCYVKDFVNEAEYTGSGIEFIRTDPRHSPAPAREMVQRIDAADLVISCETVLCLAVARGKPALAYNARAVPATGHVPAAHYELYRQYYEYPWTLEELSVQDVLDFSTMWSQRVEDWKRGNIGDPFDAAKFINIIREYV